jgi:hypothetical protein
MSIGIELITSALVLGLAGSLHCVGMCGPLALSLPVSHSNQLSRIGGGAVYNTGRIFSYSALGLLFGSVGGLIIAGRWQGNLSIVLGIIILLYLFVPKRYFRFSSNHFFKKPFLWLRELLGKLFQSRKFTSLFFIGMLNGLLPCGLLYLALSSAAVSASTLHGGLFMLFFGIGTFPAMIAMVVMGNYLNQSLRRKINTAVPVLLFFMAVLLILRGMNLGIPFISPALSMGHQHEAVSCH